MAKITLVDDEDLMRDALAQLLPGAGHVTFEASKALEEDSFDLVVTDVYMQRSDGTQLALQAREVCPALEGITISGGGVQRDSKLATRLASFYGADQVLEEPVDNDELLDAISNLLAH